MVCTRSFSAVSSRWTKTQTALFRANKSNTWNVQNAERKMLLHHKAKEAASFWLHDLNFNNNFYSPRFSVRFPILADRRLYLSEWS